LKRKKTATEHTDCAAGRPGGRDKMSINATTTPSDQIADLCHDTVLENTCISSTSVAFKEA